MCNKSFEVPCLKSAGCSATLHTLVVTGPVMELGTVPLVYLCTAISVDFLYEREFTAGETWHDFHMYMHTRNQWALSNLHQWVLEFHPSQSNTENWMEY